MLQKPDKETRIVNLIAMAANNPKLQEYFLSTDKNVIDESLQLWHDVSLEDLREYKNQVDDVRELAIWVWW